MIWYLVLIIGIAALFYTAFPAIGAFIVRAQWRTFRRTVIEVSRYPTAGPAAIGRERSAAVGKCRFFGTLEAIQGDDRIWITNGRLSVAAELRGVRVYLIPESEGGTEQAPGDRGAAGGELRSVPWSRIFSLPEGTPIFLGGVLYAEEGRGVFRGDRETPLLVVIHDCSRESIVSRAIGSGRQRNEYMNSFTLPSVAIGSLSLLLLGFSLLAGHTEARGIALLALTVGLAPVSPFLPPGFPFYFAYRSFWKKARVMRAQRDVVRLPLRYFPGPDGSAKSAEYGGAETRRDALLPDREPYLMLRGTTAPDEPNVMVSNGIRVQLPADIRKVAVELPPRERGRTRATPGESVVFASYSESAGGVMLKKPEDPMAEQVFVPGDPDAISRESERVALRYEIVSGLFITLNVVVNLPLMFVLLALLIR
ncbi:MAG: hypothetical protein ABSG63_09305 [Spirochaetia bacterium]|jgi:hypothetical protein